MSAYCTVLCFKRLVVGIVVDGLPLALDFPVTGLGENGHIEHLLQASKSALSPSPSPPSPVTFQFVGHPTHTLVFLFGFLWTPNTRLGFIVCVHDASNDHDEPSQWNILAQWKLWSI